VLRLKKKEYSGIAKSFTLVGSFGLTMGVAILIGYYLGNYLDGLLGTAPWLMLLFLILFMIGAFVKFIQETREVKIEKKTENMSIIRKM